MKQFHSFPVHSNKHNIKINLKNEMPAVILLYLFGPSSRQKESVRVASSSKNSVAKASHHKLSLSCEKKNILV